MLRGGRVEAVEERGDAFAIRQHLAGEGRGERIVTYLVPKTPWEVWWEDVRQDLPAARSEHTAIWTGNEMIVWGGGASGRGSSRILPGYGRAIRSRERYLEADRTRAHSKKCATRWSGPVST